MDSGHLRKPCFIEDDGLASIADIEAGCSGTHYQNSNGFFSRPLICYSRRSSLRKFSSFVSSPRFYEARFEENQPHFLDACFLCKKSLAGGNRDIFMYRGDTPFCSEECRQEQIDVDEAKEKKWNLSSSMKALRKKDQRKSEKAQDYPFRTGTVAAA